MKRYLQEIGFSAGEEKVYLSLLKIGESTTGNIAKEAKVSRSKVYEILDKLNEKGIISHFKKDKISYFRAAPPKRISEYLDEKAKEISAQKKEFENNLPFFNKLIGQKDIMKGAEIFKGMEGIKNVRETALSNMRKGDVMYYFGNPASGHEHVLGYWDDWNRRRRKKKIWIQCIYNQDASEFGERRSKETFSKIRYLPKKGDTHAWIEIYEDTLVIAMKYKTPMSIVINNVLVAESFRTYFKIMWDCSISAEEVKK